jgi:outer membrane murein-binding lipoprotein Lpp
MAPPALTDSELHALYVWVDEIPLSRPKKNIARDFSDGVCVAEIVKHYFPKVVELHNYPATLASKQKKANWETLNNRVFRKVFGFQVTAEEIGDIVSAVPGAVEHFLRSLQAKIAQLQNRRSSAAAHEADGPSRQYQPAPYSQHRPTSGASEAGDEKDQVIGELSTSVRLLTQKVKQLEELVRIRDEKIAALQRRQSH